MFTAQWATGKSGGRYRYYRCTKKKGYCKSGYVREDVLLAQIQERIESISLPDRYTGWMLNKVDEWEREENTTNGGEVQNLSSKIRAGEERMERLVSAYLDGVIPKTSYLTRKDEIMRVLASLNGEKKDFENGKKKWVEPLRAWVLDTKHALDLSLSDNLHEIADFVRRTGTNPRIESKSMHFRVSPPSENTARLRVEMSHALREAGHGSELNRDEVLICDLTGNRTPI